MSKEKNRVSTYSQVLLWFGAAVSIAEIMTGALIAPLGMGRGLLAIVIGHIIGAGILLPAGMIGAKSGLSSAQSVRISFGKYGSFGFSFVNILQLVSWTAIMILNGAKAMDAITNRLWKYQNETLWCILIGLLICLWIVIGIKNLSKMNTVVIVALLICMIILGYTVFTGTGKGSGNHGVIGFGEAVELNVAMSLSWLPLISDYTRKLKNKTGGTIGSVISYFGGSMLMFFIGLGSAIFAGTSDITAILLSAGIGLIGVIIVLLSTVTTTFLDVYSAGVSAANLSPKINEKIAAVIVCGVGIVLAIFVSIEKYESFLYLIGSVFAPMFSIMFVDYFLIHKTEIEPNSLLNVKNLILWIVGFVAYRLLMNYNFVIGTTLPVMLLTSALCLIVNIGGKKLNAKK